MDRELSDGRPWITGDQLTIADFSLCGYLFYADQAKVEVPDQVSGWLGRLTGLPGWQSPYDLLS
ncbi:MAG: glutathione S-transferase C-terminal domain-containing protein [Gammaproteobacteria bacterium]|nr:glutathione S-transferase C-terminal domain-containing protein [Gammaproteobacteria bacterium]